METATIIPYIPHQNSEMAHHYFTYYEGCSGFITQERYFLIHHVTTFTHSKLLGSLK
jgi:hypothetical protein